VQVLSYILDKIDRSNVLVASHNQNSIEFTVNEVRGVEVQGRGATQYSSTSFTFP
jgi:hypothetical protein